MPVEKRNFEANASNLFSILSESVYATPEAAIRETISNANDACDKLKSKSITNDSLLEGEPNIEIKVSFNSEEKTLTITDTGIGMTGEELPKLLGSLGESGTKRDYQQRLNSGQDCSKAIGQFGIGFYSCFLIANRVDVHSKSPYDDKAYTWSADSNTYYTIGPCDDSTLTRGTRVVLHLKEGKEEYLEPKNVENIILKYQSYITIPVFVEYTRTKEVEDDDQDDDETPKDKNDPEKTNEDGALEQVDETKKEKKKKTVTYKEFVHINKDLCIWDKKIEDITDEDYCKVYKASAKKWEAPFVSKMFSIDGNLSFKAIIFIHKTPDNDPFTRHQIGEDTNYHCKLFCRKVLITSYNKKKDFFPQTYQSLCHVLIDVDDMPKNVARENSVSNKFIKVVKKLIINKIHTILKELKNSEKWDEFYKCNEQILKFGATEDELKKDEFLSLIKFPHSSGDEKISLDEYITAAKEKNQNQVYYISGDVKSSQKNSIVLKLREKGKDCFLIHSPIDEMIFTKTPSKDGMKFQEITKEGFTLDDDEESKEKLKKMNEGEKDLLKKIVDINKSDIQKCEFGYNSDEPFYIQVPSYAPGPSTENLNQCQSAMMANKNSMAFFTQSQKTLVMNPDTDEVKFVIEGIKNDSKLANDLVFIYCQTALLSRGYMLKEPAHYANKITSMLKMAIQKSGTALINNEKNETDNEIKGDKASLDEVD